MKIILLGLIVFASFQPCNNGGDDGYTDAFLFNLKGDVRAVQDSLFIVGAKNMLFRDSICYEYGEYVSGLLKKYTEADTTGKNRTYTYYTHYDNGRWRSIVGITNGQKVDSIAFHLDKKGRYAFMQRFDSLGNLVSYTTDLQQNVYNQITTGKEYSPDSVLKGSFTATFDKHIYIGGSTFDGNGKETSKTIIQVNDKGDPIEETTVTTNGDVKVTQSRKYTYEYDEKGNWTSRTHLDKDGNPVRIIKRKFTYQ